MQIVNNKDKHSMNETIPSLWLLMSVITGIMIYILLIFFSYIYKIAPIFSYFGMVYIKRDYIFLIIEVLLSLTPFFWIPKKIRKPSDVIYWLLYLLVIIPSSIIPMHSLDRDPIQIIEFNVFLLICFFLLSMICRIPTIKINIFRIKPFTFSIVILLISILFYTIILITFGLKVNLPTLKDIYDVRSEYRDTLSISSPLIGYIVSWQANILNSLIISLGLLSKKFTLCVIGIIGDIIIFSITGFKSVFLSVLLLIALQFALGNVGRKFSYRIVWGLNALIFFGLIIDDLNQSALFTTIFTRRIIVVPGLLSGYYFDFFLEHPKALLGHSIFSPFVSNFYGYPPSRIIGYFYLGNIDINANANVWADAFANFGYIGVLLFTIFLGAVLWFYDSVTVDIDIKLSSLLIGMSAFSLSNTALLTALLTHGILFAILIACFIPIKEIPVLQLNNVILKEIK